MVYNTNIQRITSSTTLSDAFNVYLIDAGAPATIIITLPNITSDGINYKLIRTDSNTIGQVTVQGFNPSQTINGSISIRLQPNTVQALQSFGVEDVTGAVWFTGDRPFNVNSTLPLSFRFNANNGNPITTTSTTYVVLGSFIYRGTLIDNIITAILAIVNTNSTTSTGQLRVFNFTNNTVIAESAIFGPTNGTQIAINLGAISNLPTGQAIFQIQLRRASASDSAGIVTVQVYGRT